MGVTKKKPPATLGELVHYIETGAHEMLGDDWAQCPIVAALVAVDLGEQTKGQRTGRAYVGALAGNADEITRATASCLAKVDTVTGMIVAGTLNQEFGDRITHGLMGDALGAEPSTDL